ncbi:MAG: hypothetical protein ACI9DF_004530 [Verrucomicrobiales bacterium]|jgi:hypothetical protein
MPTHAEELGALLQFYGLGHKFDCTKAGKPLVELRFRSDIDMEHGIGALTDGESIFGLGYTNDFNLYQE